jgi:hypothetical protein
MQTINYKGHLIHFNSYTGSGSVSYNIRRGFLSEDIKSVSEGREKIDIFVGRHQDRINQLMDYVL